jgi:hypothetical protein
MTTHVLRRYALDAGLVEIIQEQCLRVDHWCWNFSWDFEIERAKMTLDLARGTSMINCSIARIYKKFEWVRRVKSFLVKTMIHVSFAIAPDIVYAPKKESSLRSETREPPLPPAHHNQHEKIATKVDIRWRIRLGSTNQLHHILFLRGDIPLRMNLRTFQFLWRNRHSDDRCSIHLRLEPKASPQVHILVHWWLVIAKLDLFLFSFRADQDDDHYNQKSCKEASGNTSTNCYFCARIKSRRYFRFRG